jgi:hypothetical protein
MYERSTWVIVTFHGIVWWSMASFIENLPR